ncbi:hypothetical protein M569_15063, partial [Genlisea aurea]
GVLDVIASKEKWNLEDIRVSEVDLKKAKFRTVKLYEFRIPHRKTVIHVKMHEVVSEWKKLNMAASNLEDLSAEIESKTTAIDSFTLEGPFELTASGNDDALTLMLPMNKTHSKLQKISVGQGIAVVVKGADAISGFYPSHHPATLICGICRATPRIHINGSASVSAYTSTRPTSPIIRTQISSSTDAITLLPDKCYDDDKTTSLLRGSFGSKFALLKRVLSTFLDDTAATLRGPPIKASARASTVYRFRLELERDVRKNDAYWTAFGEWRTRPSVERAWFEVAARVEDGELKPAAVKRVVGLGPVIDADRYSSGLVSNVSFTKFPSLLVAPEALTLEC